MKSYIKAIIIFNKNGEKRLVPLKQGVNIITGESKTGKSALVEIIDYCLCSARCTIPKGKITDFSYIYSLIMNINDDIYIIARRSWETGGKMYFSKENIDFDENTLSLNYFTSKNGSNCKDVQLELESALGLSVTNLATGENLKNKKASLRNMVSYLFQHQNLIASKFALFYRFSDYYKRKDVIDQFPVFAGIVNQEYYSDLITVSDLEKKLKQQIKKQDDDIKSKGYIRENLLPLFEDYYALLGLEFNKELKLEELLITASNLPEFDEKKLINNETIIERYNNLNKQLEELENKERNIILTKKKIEKTSVTGNDLNDELKKLEQKTNIASVEVSKYICPICGQNCEEISKKDFEIQKATEWLKKELVVTKKYTVDFSEDIRKLNRELSKIKTEKETIRDQLDTIEKKYITLKEVISTKEKVDYAKTRIKLHVEMIDSGIFKTKAEDLKQIREQISEIRKKIQQFKVKEKLNEAQSFLSKNMNSLAKTLDFEYEFLPANLRFDLVDGTFDMYQKQRNGEKIHLYEMGSGANWVSCHIALFLSFLRYFATQDNSPMPLIMFFDQPSQVYFPQSDDNLDKVTQKDIEAVDNMYTTIFNEINSIGEDTGILPQIIIVDHVDGKKLLCKEEFEKYVRCEWRNGEALI